MGFPLIYSDAACCENDSKPTAPGTTPANHDNGKLLRVIEIHVNPRIQSCLYLIRKRLSYKTTFISYSEKIMLKDRKPFRKA